MKTALIMSCDLVGQSEAAQPGRLCWMEIDAATGEGLSEPVHLLLHRDRADRASWRGMRQMPTPPAAALRWLAEDFRSSRAPHVVADPTSEAHLGMLVERAALGSSYRLPFKPLNIAMRESLGLEPGELGILLAAASHELPPVRADALSALRRMQVLWAIVAEARWRLPEIQAALAWAGGPR